ncbi:uncharacterized protein LOC107610703 [Arachis ipaensis]|uniref:uncharacterized protein LOC107610703 n=1 Tax=Arachis ipaensis TaxID=130454 RepID=UPI0007AF7186|nr:uncharacterized protein LOC107610703 [Arachis ipaensis]XP_025670000.1 uncharacterized protein LOC112769741 [Arachis hypogaea]
MSTDGAERSDTLVRGNCEMVGKTLIALFDIGSSHSFIAFEKASELGLKINVLAYDLEVHTPTTETAVTRLGCQQVPFRVKHQNFVHDLIGLPMTDLDLILRLDWLSKNRVLLNCSERSLQFMSEWSENCGCECQSLMLLATTVSGKEQSLNQISVVNIFPKVFLKDIPEFPSSQKIEFAIELVPGTRPILIAPY